jgi:hypothetical protein
MDLHSLLVHVGGYFVLLAIGFPRLCFLLSWGHSKESSPLLSKRITELALRQEHRRGLLIRTPATEPGLAAKPSKE